MAHAVPLVEHFDDDQIEVLQREAMGVFDDANDSVKLLQQHRNSTPWRKARSAVQPSLASFAGFLKRFSGLTEIVKGADEQFGGIAYGMLSLLVCIAEQKQLQEDNIQEALAEMASVLPRLTTLEGLKSEPTVRKMVVKAFACLLYVCRETVDYCTSRSTRTKRIATSRWTRTILQLKTILLDVRREIDFVIFTKLISMEAKLESIRLTGLDTNASFKSYRSREDAQYLDQLHSALGIAPDLDAAAELNTYKSKLNLCDNRKRGRRRRSGRAHTISWETFQNDPDFRLWLNKQHSSIILLGGDNIGQNSYNQLNWLSHASVLLNEDKLRQRKDDPTSALPSICVSFYCLKDYSMTSRQKEPYKFSNVMRHIIWQLVVQHPTFLHDRRQVILNTACNSAWDDQSHDAIVSMFTLIKTLIISYPEGTSITIILDRLDQCPWIGDLNDRCNDLSIVLKELLTMIRDSSLLRHIVKVLIVMDDEHAQQTAEYLRYSRGTHLDWKLGWRFDWTDISDDSVDVTGGAELEEVSRSVDMLSIY